MTEKKRSAIINVKVKFCSHFARNSRLSPQLMRRGGKQKLVERFRQAKRNELDIGGRYADSTSAEKHSAQNCADFCRRQTQKAFGKFGHHHQRRDNSAFQQRRKRRLYNKRRKDCLGYRTFHENIRSLVAGIPQSIYQ